MIWALLNPCSATSVTPGELLHVEIRKLGRCDKAGHRITGNRSSQRARDIGWGYVFVAVDDHSRAAFTQVCPDEARHSYGPL